ncbi:hypothetical protein [Alteribacillus sp. YIM 98480]|uniref:hypothetical protein n=1 Tax=Alteribacillus sp. YIM 98480 TaxID=2606599 RepID=UPI00131C8980|nr:hypothetical protein [Alteribacillus sp. YIM 98480]
MRNLALVFLGVILTAFTGISEHVEDSSQKWNNRIDGNIYHNQLSEEEERHQEKELEKFLDKEAKPNALLPLPNSEDKLNIDGMPLPDDKPVEPKNLN